MTRAGVRRWMVWAALTLGVCALAALLVRPAPAGGPTAGGRGRADPRAPALRLPTLAGRPVSLAAFRGRPVALVFLATWCEGCQQELPALVGAARALRPQGLVVLGIDAVAEPPSTVARFARRYGVPFPILLDPSSDAMTTFGVRALPTTIIVGADGTIVAHLESAVDAATLRRVALGHR
jgi:peroxiredoxin